MPKRPSPKAIRKDLSFTIVDTKDMNRGCIKVLGRSEYGYDAFGMDDPSQNEILFVGNDPMKVAKRGDEIDG